MSNFYFRCKQFTIYQDRCAMKVGTDGMVLGAWVNVTGANRILDGGTGTGLLALMLAQRSPAQIDAVEIDPAAVLQARENVARSAWGDRIQIHSSSLQDFAAQTTAPYDLLISNPPFFAAPATRSPARTLARANATLSPADLLQAATQLLCPTGRLAVIYPPEVAVVLEREAREQGWGCAGKLYLHPRATQPIKRIALELSRQPCSLQESTLVIYATGQQYSADYIALMQDFYLKY